MRTTFNIDRNIVARLKEEAARRGCTMSELVEEAFRLLLEDINMLAPLPSFKSGGALVDISDRCVLYDMLEKP